MSNKILFKFSFENGWGDTFLSIFDIVNCADFIKKTYPDYELELIINDEFNVNTLDKVINLEFFNNFFNEFKILNKDNLFKNLNGFSNYNGVEYKRLYSGRNQNIFNNINGIFDVFIPLKEYENVANLNIPFIDFTFNDVDDRANDFDVFNKDIVTLVDDFISNNLDSDFESIYYRALTPLNHDKIIKFRDEVSKTLDPNKKYFICSNASFVKKVFSELNLNIKMYRDLENHNPNLISNGFTRYGQTLEEALFVVGELLILSKSKNIYYSGDISFTSLFNWYSINIKKVKLTNIVV